MTPTSRLAELGLTLPAVATPVGAYVPALREGTRVTTSGQLPLVAGALPLTGKLGAEVSPEQGKDLARTAVLNALAAAADAAGGLDAITGISRVCVFVASDPGFTGQAAVANGASELLGAVFGTAGRHVRSAVGVAVLPLDAPVEVELTVTLA